MRRRKSRELGETVLLALMVFAFMAIAIAWPFLLVAMSGG